MLAEIRAEPFPVTIQGVGAFGGRDPRVLWAGVEAGEPLAALYRANERAARAAGLEADPRNFKPHVTLARMRGAKQQAVARFLQEHGGLRTQPFMVTPLRVAVGASGLRRTALRDRGRVSVRRRSAIGPDDSAQEQDHY